MKRKGEDKTMDKKQITKIETKHKGAVLIAAIALLAVFAFIFLFSSIERQGKEQQILSEEEREQLMDMTTYLDEIDRVVTMNQERLTEATLFQSDTEHVLDMFKESLSVLENDLAEVAGIVQNHTKTETTTNNEIASSIMVLSESQQAIKSMIDEMNVSIAATVSEIRAESDSNFTSTIEKLETLEADLEKTQKEANNYYDSLTKLITLLQEDNNSQYEEFANELLIVQAELAKLLENDFEALQLQLDKDFTALMEKLNSLHGQIVETSDSIAELLLLMEENNADRQKEIKAAFAAVSASLELIKTEYTDAHAELQNLIQKVQETQNANHEETLSVLTVMETNMEETSLENLNRITDSLQIMEESFSTSISNMQGEMQQNFTTLNTGIADSFSQTNDSITNQFKELSTDISNQYQNISSQYQNISNQYQNISSTITNNNSGQQESMENLINNLNNKLQEVFQFVSNGKKMVASALLTKGVSIQEDAAFAEIYQAILDIPQELVIGVQEIPGIVTYDYHYHINGSGNITHSESETISGGCYTVPVYHVHSGDSRNGGGCYTIPITHTHTAECYIVTIRERKVIARWHTDECTGHACCDEAYGQNWAKFGYEDNVYVNGVLVSSVRGEGDLGYCCGLCLDRKAAEQGSRVVEQDIICGYSDGLNGYQTGCGKDNTSIERYTTGCGLADGQIIGAIISYDQSAVAHLSVEAFSMESENEVVENETVFTDTTMDTNMEISNTAEITWDADTEISEYEELEMEEGNGDIGETSEGIEPVKEIFTEEATMQEAGVCEDSGTIEEAVTEDWEILEKQEEE